MRRILLLLAVAASFARPAPAAGDSTKLLEALAEQYRENGLPVPPPGSAPLLLPMFVEHNSPEGVLLFVLGFRLTADEGKDRPATFLVGPEVWKPGGHWNLLGAPIELPPGEKLTMPLQAGLAHLATFNNDQWLSAAVQCQISGRSDLAGQILDRDLAQFPREIIYNWAAAQSDDTDITANRLLYSALKARDYRKALDAVTWNYWLNAVVRPGADLREARARLDKVFARRRGLDHRARREFIEAVRLTAQPRAGAPGTPEALIDSADEQSYWNDDPSGRGGPGLAKLRDLGFEAMPALIAHMEDRRLAPMTFHVLDAPPRTVSIGTLATELVEAFAGAELFPPGPRPALGKYNSQRLARKWWTQASKSTEVDYVTSHVIPVKKEDEYQWVNVQCLRLVARKYPAHLGGIYERLMRERPDLDLDDASIEVATSSGLAREEKLRLLRMGAELPDLERRAEAIRALLKVEPAEAQTRLLHELAQLPIEFSPGNLTFISAESRIVLIVAEVNSPEVWREFGAATHRALPNLRKNFVKMVGGPLTGRKETRAPAIAFLITFLDDNAVWHDKDKSGTIADVALQALGDMFELYVPFDPTEPASRVRYRAKVDAAMAAAP